MPPGIDIPRTSRARCVWSVNFFFTNWRQGVVVSVDQRWFWDAHGLKSLKLIAIPF